MAAPSVNFSVATHNENTADKRKFQQLLQDMSHLKIKIQSLEKDLGPLIFLRKLAVGYSFPELREYDVNLTVSRKAEEMQIIQNVKRIKSMVLSFRTAVYARPYPSPQIVIKLKILMEDIETNITEMKARQAETYKEMVREEKSLCTEIQVLQKRIESWAMQRAAYQSNVAPIKIFPPFLEEETDQHDLPPEIKTFEMFMHQTGGHTGGWDETDHTTFCRIQSTHKGHPSMENYLTGLPTKTEEEVHGHIGWFLEYRGRLTKKKEAIQKWRQKKEYEKEILAKDAMIQLAKEEQEKKKAKSMLHLKDEIHNTKIAIQKWKMEKDLEKAREEERKLVEREKALREEEKKRSEQRVVTETVRLQRKQLQARLDAEARKEEALALQKTRMTEAEKKETMKQNRVRFQERDQALLRKKIEQIQAKEKEKEEREARLLKLIREQQPIDVPRDTSRLMKPTKGWVERQKAKAMEGGDGGPLLQMPHKAVPTWRQNLY